MRETNDHPNLSEKEKYIILTYMESTCNMSDSKIKHVVADSGAFIRNAPLNVIEIKSILE